MEKRYQVFVSSTFRDLIEERREVMQALLEMDCIPAGMELFPAANEQAWQLIKRVIEESDYYCLIVGGRYGSTDETGLSYTEREYDFAVKAGLPILPFLHANPDEIPAGKVDRDSRPAKRLQEFRIKVEKRHHSKYWAGAEDLGGKVSRALVQIFKSVPRIGWVRADAVASSTALADLERFRRRTEELEAETNRLRKAHPQRIAGLARGKDRVPFSFSYRFYAEEPQSSFDGDLVVQKEHKVVAPIPLTWDEVFTAIGPRLFAGRDEFTVKVALEARLESVKQSDQDFGPIEKRDVHVAIQDVLAMLTQFLSLGLVEVNGEKTKRGENAAWWRLTAYGRDYLIGIAAIRRAQETPAARPHSPVKLRGQSK